MKLSIVLPANQIPDGTEGVRKPTGAKTYTIKHKFPVYGIEGKGEITVALNANVVFLCSESGVNLISGDTPLAVDFDDIASAGEFLDAVKASEDK